MGRYTLHGVIARGGMATVHYGRLRGAVGFSRTVAIKRLHPELARDPELVTMLMDEARMAARIHHPNVVQTLDVIAIDGELLLVLEYVEGESLARLLAAVRDKGERVPVAIAASIVAGALRGVHAAHEAKDERGAPLELVHRDLSPQNILVDVNGIARVLDFGVAKARGRAYVTEGLSLKGKVAYMAPEQIHGKTSRQSDVFAMGVVLWETLVGERLFQGGSQGEVMASILSTRIDRPSARGVQLPAALEEVVVLSLSRNPKKRIGTALEMALAIEASLPLPGVVEVSSFVHRVAQASLEGRQREVAKLESGDGGDDEAPTLVDAVDHVARPLPPPRAPGSRRGHAILALGAAAVVLVAIVFATRTARENKPIVTSPPRSGDVVATAPGAPSSSTSSSASSEVASVIAPSSVVAPRPSATGKPPTVHAAATPRRTCDPPFTLDASGRKTWKRECF